MNELLSNVASLNFFKGLSQESLELLLPAFKYESFAPSQVFIKQGDQENKDFFIITSGLASVFVVKDDTEITLKDLHPGELAGEFSFITGGTRSASVRANSTTEVIRVRYRTLLEILSKHPKIGLVIFRNISKAMANKLMTLNHSAFS
jgi:CRP-like cAMP-binding protein